MDHTYIDLALRLLLPLPGLVHAFCRRRERRTADREQVERVTEYDKPPIGYETERKYRRK